ncbi:MAG: hypothetical protein ISR65_14860 [Bacteriovoracaceae bacterium]|nr:hypothetical protein [Bacteriovoracaceae bacterium]
MLITENKTDADSCIHSRKVLYLLDRDEADKRYDKLLDHISTCHHCRKALKNSRDFLRTIDEHILHNPLSDEIFETLKHEIHEIFDESSLTDRSKIYLKSRNWLNRLKSSFKNIFFK